MKSIEVKVNLRKTTGKKNTAELRKQGLIPCVMYGGKENVHFTARLNEFRHIIYTQDTFVVHLDIEGEKRLAILKDLQFHPVTDEVLHMDFIEVFEDQPATLSLPVNIIGNSVGVRAGGKMRLKKRYLKVKGFIKDVPERLTIDISDLEIGKYFKVEDLKFDNIELLDPARAMVVGVSTSRVAKGMELEETKPAEAAAPAEGEAAAPAEGEAAAPAKDHGKDHGKEK